MHGLLCSIAEDCCSCTKSIVALPHHLMPSMSMLHAYAHIAPGTCPLKHRKSVSAKAARKQTYSAVSGQFTQQVHVHAERARRGPMPVILLVESRQRALQHHVASQASLCSRVAFTESYYATQT